MTRSLSADDRPHYRMVRRVDPCSAQTCTAISSIHIVSAASRDPINLNCGRRDGGNDAVLCHYHVTAVTGVPMGLVERLYLNSWPQNLPGWSGLIVNDSVLHPTTTGGGLMPPCISPWAAHACMMYASLPYLLTDVRSEACLAMSNPPEPNFCSPLCPVRRCHVQMK